VSERWGMVEVVGELGSRSSRNGPFRLAPTPAAQDLVSLSVLSSRLRRGPCAPASPSHANPCAPPTTRRRWASGTFFPNIAPTH
jgi:hypothetical protein